MGVALRVMQVGFAQGPQAPVRALEFFGEGHAVIVVDGRGQAQSLGAQEAPRDHGVEEVGEAEAVVALEAEHVVLAGVEDLLDAGVGGELPEGREVRDRDGVHDVILARRGYLQEADLLLVGVEAVGLRVDGDARLLAQFGDDFLQVLPRRDQGGGGDLFEGVVFGGHRRGRHPRTVVRRH